MQVCPCGDVFINAYLNILVKSFEPINMYFSNTAVGQLFKIMLFFWVFFTFVININVLSYNYFPSCTCGMVMC